MSRTHVALLLVGIALVAAVVAGCPKAEEGATGAGSPGMKATIGGPAAGGASAPSGGQTKLLLLGPCGMTAPMAAVIKQFEAAHPDVKIDMTTDNSVIIAKRVTEKGAACDLFISPGSRQLGILEKQGIPDMTTVKPFTTFELVCIVPKSNPAEIKSPQDLMNAKVVSMPNADLDSVGYAGREALKKLGLWDKLSGRLITTDDAIVSHTWVATKKSQAGISFRNCPLETNPAKLSLSKVSIAFKFAPDTYTPVKGLVAMTKSCKSPEVAKQFIDYVLSPDGQKTIMQFGLDGANGEKATGAAPLDKSEKPG